MKNAKCFIGLCLPLLAIEVGAQTLVSGQNPVRFDGLGSRSNSLNTLVYLPGDAAQNVGKKWPAIFFLHGSGERGTNIMAVTKHGPPKLVKDRKDFEFIVISPQCPPGQQWSSEVVVALVEQAKARYPVDPDRVYLTGLSMGGYGTWSVVMSHPELFAAAIPICGGGDPVVLKSAPPATIENLKHLPIWAFHGGKDPTVNVTQSQRMVAAMVEIGVDAKLTIYPEAVHDSWTQTYGNPEVFAWLLKHDRKSNAKLPARAPGL